MNVYMYRAALYCEDCGAKICARHKAEGKAPESPDDERTYDSDDYPKGPYPDGGGEADSPEHCDACGLFLANDLTTDGLAYVQQAVDEHYEGTRKHNGDVIAEWKECYRITPSIHKEESP